MRSENAQHYEEEGRMDYQISKKDKLIICTRTATKIFKEGQEDSSSSKLRGCFM